MQWVTSCCALVLCERFVGSQHIGNACGDVVIDAVAAKLQTAGARAQLAMSTRKQIWSILHAKYQNRGQLVNWYKQGGRWTGLGGVIGRVMTWWCSYRREGSWRYTDRWRAMRLHSALVAAKVRCAGPRVRHMYQLKDSGSLPVPKAHIGGLLFAAILTPTLLKTTCLSHWPFFTWRWSARNHILHSFKQPSITIRHRIRMYVRTFCMNDAISGFLSRASSSSI